MSLSMNIGKGSDGSHLLVLANQDTAEVYPVAVFLSEDHARGFTMFMETQGYIALNLPSQAELDEFLKDQ